jgi:uncharacterized protein (DUF1501 family)
MLSRRSFLTSALRGSTLVALAPTVPGFLVRTATAAEPKRDGRILVVVQLDGGNDGINTVVPFKDEGYAKHSTALRLPTDRLIKISNELGLHPSLRSAAKLFEAGGLAIVQGVGYPNPSRSHFKSMAIWHTGNPDLPRGDIEDVDTRAGLGWIGRALDGAGKLADGSPSATYVGADTLPVALRGRRSVASSICRLEDSVLSASLRANRDVPSGSSDDLAAFVQRRTLDAYTSSDRIAEVLKAGDVGPAYPATALAERLRLVGRLIKGGAGTRIFYTTQRGYDTHAAQPQAHAELLAEFGGAVRAFLDDLGAAKLAERVALLAFSEFGRRVLENGDAGTDHGTAGPVFLAGPGVHGGIVGATPSLTDLDNGDLKVGIDFRRVYASALEDWLGLPSKPALVGDFAKLSLFRS